MEIKTAMHFMPDLEKVCELEKRRFFCNADETINTISIYSMKKQIPIKPKVMEAPLKNEKFWWFCGSCGASRHTGSRSNYCSYCGQRVDWSEYVRNNYKNVSEDRIEHAKMVFPELQEEGKEE